MNSRAAAWFVAVVFIVAGCWLSWEGWHKKWGAKGISFRLGGMVTLVGGAYAAMAATRR